LKLKNYVFFRSIYKINKYLLLYFGPVMFKVGVIELEGNGKNHPMLVLSFAMLNLLAFLKKIKKHYIRLPGDLK